MRSMTALIVSILAGSIVLMSTTAHAQLVRVSCTMYVPSDPAPPVVKAFCAKLHDEAKSSDKEYPEQEIAVRACNYIDSNKTRYEIRGPVWKDSLGVCHMQRNAIYPETTKKGELVFRDPPQDPFGGFETAPMYFGPGTCPKANEDRYISVEFVSPGLFRQIVTLWDRLSSSHVRFDNEVRNAAVAHGDLRPELKRKLFSKANGVPKIESISWFPCISREQSFCGYEVNYRDPDKPSHWYILHLDVGDDGIQLLEIGESIA